MEAKTMDKRVPAVLFLFAGREMERKVIGGTELKDQGGYEMGYGLKMAG